MSVDRTWIVRYGAERIKVKEPIKIMCRRFFCKRVGVAACCTACPERSSCDEACMNSPDRCGLVRDN